MRRWPGQYLRLGVSRTSLCLLQAGRWRGDARVAGEAQIDASAEDRERAVAQALDALLAATTWRRWPLEIILDDDWCRLWSVTPPADASRMSDLRAATAFRFQRLYGEPPDAWQVQADWRAHQTFFAAALPSRLHEQLHSVTERHQLALVKMQPHFVVVWNRWQHRIGKTGWLGVLQANQLSLGVARDGILTAQRTLAVPPKADRDWLDAALRREALLLDVPAPASLALCGPVPASWAGQSGEEAISCRLLGPAAMAASMSDVAWLAMGGDLR
jgi:hypothetical protein